MKNRCRNTKLKLYPRYGGRGIDVCDRWAANFEAFLKDVGRRPSPDHSLDRIDNDRGYEPGNVRWADRAVQASNTSKPGVVIFGEKMSFPDAVKRFAPPSVTAALARTRVQAGWDRVEAILTPKGMPGIKNTNRVTLSP